MQSIITRFRNSILKHTCTYCTDRSCNRIRLTNSASTKCPLSPMQNVCQFVCLYFESFANGLSAVSPATATPLEFA